MADGTQGGAGWFERTPPVLFTDRLLMRVHVEADLDAAAAMWADPEVVRHISGKPSTREEVWLRILRYRGHWTLRPFGYWAVTERASGRFVGEIGLSDWKRLSLADLPGALEAGWVISPEAQGLGYATEALNGVLAWTDENMAADTICIIDDENTRSIRLAERAGYRPTPARIVAERQPTRYRRALGGLTADAGGQPR